MGVVVMARAQRRARRSAGVSLLVFLPTAILALMLSMVVSANLENSAVSLAVVVGAVGYLVVWLLNNGKTTHNR